MNYKPGQRVRIVIAPSRLNADPVARQLMQGDLGTIVCECKPRTTKWDGPWYSCSFDRVGGERIRCNYRAIEPVDDGHEPAELTKEELYELLGVRGVGTNVR